MTRNGEFKRYRIQKEKIRDAKNEVLEKFIDHIDNMITFFKKDGHPTRKTKLVLSNSESAIDKIKYDLVITSPPYGDSRTTVAYGQYSSFGLEWTKDINTFGPIDYTIDRECIGKQGPINKEIYANRILVETIEKIKKIDQKRSSDVLYFFNGYYNVVKSIAKNLNKNGKVCFIVGNRIVKGEQIPMDQITALFLKELGLKFEDIFVRNILNKVMPSQNSPTNQVGITSQTMKNEYIVIFTR